MKESRLKRLLQRLAVRTQFWPFTSVYRGLYNLAIDLCVRRLQRIRGVRAIYLRRGLAGGQPFYGLSDLDLMVLVDDEQYHLVAERVRYQYELLRRVIPILPPGELWLYHPRQFRELYEHSLFYRNRFLQGRLEWRRLYGEDLFKDLPPPVPGEERELALEELHPAWFYLAQELNPDALHPPYLRRYVSYKAVADAARAALVAQGEDPPLSREAAWARACREYPELSQDLEEAGRRRHDLLSPAPVAADPLLRAFLGLARRALRAGPPVASARLRLRIPPLSPETLEIFLPRGAVREISQACAALKGVERAVLLPRLSFEAVAVSGLDPGALAGATMDALDLVLIGQRLPPADELRAFNLALDRFRPQLNTYFCDLEVALALRPFQGRTIKALGYDPEFFAGLHSTTRLEGSLELAGAVEVDHVFPRADALAHRTHTLLQLFRQPEAFRLPIPSFFALFWEAARAAVLVAQARRPGLEVTEVPVSSGQVLESLSALTPEVAPALKQIHREYLKGVKGEAAEALRYICWAGQYAVHLQDLLFPSGEGTPLPLPPVRMESTISVMIVTRNRESLLGLALKSLVNQERPPDQVVVVDNASSDGTSRLARSFAQQLPLTLVREETVGIPYARNTGLKHCTGDLVAVMDDDCVAGERWLKELELPFLKDPHIGAVGGSILPLESQSGLVARFYSSRMDQATTQGAKTT